MFHVYSGVTCTHTRTNVQVSRLLASFLLKPTNKQGLKYIFTSRLSIKDLF